MAAFPEWLRLVRWNPLVIVALAGVAILGFAAYSRMSYLSLRDTQQAEMLATVARTRTAFVSHVDRLLDYGDSTLRSVRAVYAHTHSKDAALAHIAEAKAPRADAFSGVVAGVDENGVIFFHTHDRSLLNSTVNTSLEFFSTFRNDPGDRLFIDPTRVGRNTGLLQFRLVRPIIEQGRFAGVVVLNVEPRLINTFHRDLNLGEHSLSMLMTRDLRLISRAPAARNGDPLAPVPGAELWRQVDMEAAPVGRLPDNVVVDGVSYTFHYARLSDYPLVAVIGVADDALDESMAAPERDFARMTVAFSLTTAVIAALLVGFVRTNAKLAEANRETLEVNRNLTRSNALLERSNADLEQFAFVASHDLQTPLRNIGSFAQLVSHRYGAQLDDDGREFLKFIVDGAQHMSGLVRDLLGYARVSSQGRLLVSVSAAEVVAEVLGRLRGVIAENDADIEVAPLPEVLAEAGQLAQLFQNLIENALKYRRPEEAPRIRLWAEPAGAGMCRICVADNGIGIEPQYFEKIFEIFQRLHPVGRYPGTGIGLALCRRIVTRMGGEIGVQSQPGQGATFHFTAIVAGASDRAG